MIGPLTHPKLVLPEWQRFLGHTSTGSAAGVVHTSKLLRASKASLDVFKSRAVKAVAPGLGNHVHDTTHGAPNSGWPRADDFEFLYSVDVRNHDVGRPANVGVDDAVKEIQL